MCRGAYCSTTRRPPYCILSNHTASRTEANSQSSYSHTGLFGSNPSRKGLSAGSVCSVRMVSRHPFSRSSPLLSRSSLTPRWRWMSDSCRIAAHRPSKTARLPTPSTSALPTSIGSRRSTRPRCLANLMMGTVAAQSPLWSMKYASCSSRSMDVRSGERAMIPLRPLATNWASICSLTFWSTALVMSSRFGPLLICVRSACLVCTEWAALLITRDRSRSRGGVVGRTWPDEINIACG
mmetsp:Transcript_19080/g.54723  ORF Transcript_19080/g.54723 Transcript_19080/m.54723 type:complete len:237 (-) Transcript_19080:77-787(-)